MEVMQIDWKEASKYKMPILGANLGSLSVADSDSKRWVPFDLIYYSVSTSTLSTLPQVEAD